MRSTIISLSPLITRVVLLIVGNAYLALTHLFREI